MHKAATQCPLYRGQGQVRRPFRHRLEERFLRPIVAFKWRVDETRPMIAIWTKVWWCRRAVVDFKENLPEHFRRDIGPTLALILALAGLVTIVAVSIWLYHPSPGRGAIWYPKPTF